MLGFIPGPLRGVLASLTLALNTLIFCWPLFIGALFKAVLPFQAARRVINHGVHASANAWISVNSAWMYLVQPIQWDVQGLEKVNLRDSYLVTSNHQTWVDILILQHLLNRRAPFLKFFLKQQLIWVPVIGLCWWALEFPFMKRFSKQYLVKHPEKRGQDMATTRKACEKFAMIPTSVMNFLEGTRFTPAKHRQQNSPYQHLLKPKVGGMALALNAMGEKFQAIVDVTIVYPDGAPHFMDFLMGKVKRITVRVRLLPVPQHLVTGDYAGDPAVREAYQKWGQQLWTEKDALIERLIHESSSSSMNPPA